MSSKNLNKRLAILVLAICAAGSYAPKASAYIAVAGLLGARDLPLLDGINPVQAFFLWPFLMLDKRTASMDPQFTTAALNGLYSPEEISLIQRDQQNLVKSLLKKNLKLEVRDFDTATSISGEIRSIYPKASLVFLQWYADSMGLKGDI